MVEHNEDDLEILDKDYVMEETAFLKRTPSFDLAQTNGISDDQAWHIIEHANEDWEKVDKKKC